MISLTRVRQFHNTIKRDIIQDAYANIPYTLQSDKISVLDLACGRGGDMHKFFMSNYQHVYAIDKDEDSIHHAIERYKNSYVNKQDEVARRSAFPFLMTHSIADLRESALIFTFRVNTVVMNFALNYFFESEEILHRLMTTISNVLKPGGTFVGIALDGARVQELIRHDTLPETSDIISKYISTRNIKNKVYSDGVYILEPRDTFYNEGPYGRAYSWSFTETSADNDTLPSNYYQFIGGNQVEYLLDIDELIHVARQHDLLVLNGTPIHVTDKYKEGEGIFYTDVIFKFIRSPLSSSPLTEFQQQTQTVVFEPLPSVLQTTKKYGTTSMNTKSNIIEIMSNDDKMHFFPVSTLPIDMSKLQVTTESLYSSSRKQGSALLVDIIRTHFLYQKQPSIIIDATANVGTDTIALALHFDDSIVWAIEKDSINMSALENNIKVYGLNNIHAIHDDSIHVLDSTIETIDVLYIDAPWGGKNYKLKTSMRLYLNDLELSDLYIKYKDRTSFFVFKVPVNYDMEYLQERVLSVNPNARITVIPFKIRRILTKFHFITIV